MLDGDKEDQMYTELQTMVMSFVCVGFCTIFAMYPNTKQTEHWWNTLPALFGVAFLGCGLDLMKVSGIHNIEWCAGYLAMVYLGHWLMKAGARQYLESHAFQYLDTFEKRR